MASHRLNSTPPQTGHRAVERRSSQDAWNLKRCLTLIIPGADKGGIGLCAGSPERMQRPGVRALSSAQRRGECPFAPACASAFAPRRTGFGPLRRRSLADVTRYRWQTPCCQARGILARLRARDPCTRVRPRYLCIRPGATREQVFTPLPGARATCPHPGHCGRDARAPGVALYSKGEYAHARVRGGPCA